MGSARIKGTALALHIDGVNHWADITACTLDNEEGDSDTTTFEDAASGGSRTYFLTVTAIQSTAAGSFWRSVWDSSGEEVPFIYAPHGNIAPAAGKPHFTGTCRIGPKPAIGGEAGTTSTYTFETRFDVVGTPVLDETP